MTSHVATYQRKNLNALLVIVSLIVYFFVLQLVPAFAQTPETGKAPLNFNMTIPGLGTIPITQEMIERGSIVAGIFLFIALIIGTYFLFHSLLARYKKIPRDRAFVFGWNSIRDNAWFFSGITILYLFVSNIIWYVDRAMATFFPSFMTHVKAVMILPNNWNGYALLLSLIGFLFSSYALAGIMSVSLKFVTAQQRSIRPFFLLPKKYSHFLVGNVIYSTVLFFGSFLLLIPAAWFGARYFFWSYILLSKNVSFIEAFKESAQMTKGKKFEIFLFWFLTTLITYVGVLIFGIGYFITFPFAMLASVYVYHALAKNVEKRADELQPHV